MGGEIGSTSYRAYFGGSDNAPLSQAASGAAANDGRSSEQGGFRFDGSHKKDTWMLEGDLFRGVENDTGINVSVPTLSIVDSPVRLNTFAGNLTGEWRRPVGETGEFRIKSWFDYAERPEPQASRVETRMFDTTVQYDFTAGHIHNLSVGGGERMISDYVKPIGDISFSPAQLTYANLSAFAQDEMHFAHDTLLLTVGAKLERNHFGGWGTDPSANLLWMPAKRHSIWISSARSLRTPSLFDVAVAGPFAILPASAATGGLPVLATFVPSPQFSTESVKDFEAGYRTQLSKTLSMDLTAFYDQYSNIRSAVAGNPNLLFSPVLHLGVTETTGNGVEATGKGAESTLAWQVLPAWKLEGSYTYNLVNPWVSTSAPPGTTFGSLKEPSRNKWRIQSYVNLSKSWQLDAFLYWTSQASPTNNYGPDLLVPSYTRLDIRLGYKLSRYCQLSLVGQNLLDARHLEAVAELLSTQSYVNRAAYLKSTWQF